MSLYAWFPFVDNESYTCMVLKWDKNVVFHEHDNILDEIQSM